MAEKFSEFEAKVYRTDITASSEEGFIRGDISDPGFIKTLIADIMNREGRIDVLINIAGICPRNGVFNISHEEWQKVKAYINELRK